MAGWPPLPLLPGWNATRLWIVPTAFLFKPPWSKGKTPADPKLEIRHVKADGVLDNKLAPLVEW